jgi:hypothetical protein
MNLCYSYKCVLYIRWFIKSRVSAFQYKEGIRLLARQYIQHSKNKTEENTQFRIIKILDKLVLILWGSDTKVDLMW